MRSKLTLTRSMFFTTSQSSPHPVASAFCVIIYGHSHKPAIKTRNNVLYINPSSAGPRRLSLPVTAATLALRSDRCEASIIQLM
jgi:uncharacterized protein